MTLRKQYLVAFMVFGVIAVTAPASRAQFFTVAPGGPSGFAPATVFGPPYGLPPVIGPGPTPLLLAPPPPNPPAPPGAYIIDAMSSGTEAGNAYVFSVGIGAGGLPGSPVAFEAGVGTPPSHFFGAAPPGPPLPPEQAGDIFVSTVNFLTGLPHPTFGIPALAGAIPPGTLIGADEFALGLNCGPAAGANDDMNSLMLRVPAGGLGTMYYSLAAAGLGPGAFYGPADIISPLLPLGVPWAPAAALGLVAGDDIDALIIQDLAPAAVYAPGVDWVAFSLAPASPTLAAIGALPGDLLLAVPAGPPVVFIPAAAFGMAGGNLDAIDVIFIDRCSNTNPPTPPNKWIELPNLVNGMTVRATEPKILADDFRCNLTGPITDIHLWGAWLDDVVGTITNFHISIHADIPVSTNNFFSRPGTELWSTNFLGDQFVSQFYTNAPEPFYDPNVNAIIGGDTLVFRYNFCIDPSMAFVQTNGVIYWLDVQAYTTNGMFGWKSAVDHCYDDAVWGDTPTNTLVWNELRYPGGPLTNQSFDLAFELTTPIPFNQWQTAYFGSTNCTLCGGAADFDGDGMSNTNEYLSGTVPTNSASAFRISSIVRQGSGSNDINVTWTTVGGHSYVVQTNSPPISGNYTNNFSDLSLAIAVPGVGESITNYIDVGAGTNNPVRYYRLRLGPPVCE